MNIEDIILPPENTQHEKWRLGSLIHNEIPEKGIALLFVSELRGAGKGAEMLNFSPIRCELYRLSGSDFEIPVCDLGDLISGRSVQDSHYILQEVLSECHSKKTIPIIVGGSNDLAFSLFSALNFHQKEINYTQISNVVSLQNNDDEINETNYISRIFSSKNFSIKNFHLLGYQKHLNENESLNILKEVDFDAVRLSEMMNSTVRTEPYFRHADLVTVNCDAVESFAEPFSINPQVNGLNRREICGYMKEIGLSENLKSVGIFNFDFKTKNLLNNQLLAQMLWYLIEGLNIRESHPKEKKFETFWVLIEDKEYAFKRDTFTNLWYFGADEKPENCLPCSAEDYTMAKKGILSERIIKFIP